MSKSKWPCFVFDDLKVEIVPFADARGIGYIRFESHGEYLGALDSRTNKASLKKMKSAIDSLLRQKLESAGAKGEGE